MAALALAALGCGTHGADDRGGDPAGGGAGSAAPPGAGTGDATGGSVATGSGGATGSGAGGGDAVASGDAGSAARGATGAAGAAGAASTTPGSITTQSGNPDWAMMGYDLGSTYFNRAESVLTKDNAATLAEIWTDDLVSNVYGAPLMIGDKIFASGPSQVRAYEAATGTELWRASVGTTASIAHSEGTLYVNTTGGQIVALDASSGDVRFMKKPDTQNADGSGSPVIAGDAILIGGANGGIELIGGTFRGYLAALDRTTGDVRWRTHTVPEGAKGASIWSSAAADLAANRAYATTGNNYGAPATDTSDAFIAFDLGSGEIVWKNQRTEGDTFSGSNRASPDYDFGANPVLYEAMVDGVMTQLISSGAKSGVAHAVRRDDGTLVWTRGLCEGTANGSRGIFVNATWSGEHMLFACNEGGPSTLYALDGATGDIAWMRPLSALVWGRISVANGVGFVGVDTTLEVFDVDTGAVIKSIPSKGGTIAGTISIANGRVAFGEGLSWNSGKRGSTLTVLAVQ
jgi:outer membrane protein assembly factor BamB